MSDESFALKNRFLLIFTSLVVIGLIGYVDYITGSELSFSFFYLIPITLFSLSKQANKESVITAAFFASILWFFAEYNGREYSSIFFPIWNAFVRLVIFLAIGLLLLYLKEKQRKIDEANAALKLVNEEKNKFVGMAAHDIRNPLGAIYSFSDLVLMNHKDSSHPDVIEALTFIKNISQNALVILRNLLDISQIEAGKVELKIVEHNYAQFVNEQVVMNQLIANQKQITIQLANDQKDTLVHFDEHYLSQVLNNLLSNAIKYSQRETSIQVNVRIANGLVRTEVKDQGKGIPKDEQQKLFGYFQTTSTQPTAGEQSTGLGLAIAKRIVTMHGGEIGLESEPGMGSIFYFTIPLS